MCGGTQHEPHRAKKAFTWGRVTDVLKRQGVLVLAAGLDEAPMAYKDIHEVMAAQADLVEIVARFDPKLVLMRWTRFSWTSNCRTLRVKGGPEDGEGQAKARGGAMNNTLQSCDMVGLVLILAGCVASSLETGDAAYGNGDFAAAAAAYEQGMAQGDAAATFALAVMYSNGEGVDPDEARAVELLQKAADMGSAEAHSALGYRYLQGQGVAQKTPTALRHLLTTANKGDGAAWFILGRVFETGRGVEPNAELSEFFYVMARGHGFAAAGSGPGQ